MRLYFHETERILLGLSEHHRGPGRTVDPCGNVLARMI
jgi:hypothetical protein